MRILYLSAFYPPQVVGGWEQLVDDINQGLMTRGHQGLVLTSRWGVKAGDLPLAGVRRELYLEADMFRYRPLDFFLYHSQRLKANLDTLQQTVANFQPDIIFIHGMYNLSPRIAWLAEKLRPGRVVYYMANDWPVAQNAHQAYWLDPARKGAKRWMKQLLAPIALGTLGDEKPYRPAFERVLTVSQAVRRDLAVRAGIPFENMQVIYNGVELDRFTPRQAAHSATDQLRLVYAGSLVKHKGVHTAVEAMALLAQNPALKGVTLDIVGSGHPDYETGLRQRVRAARLEGRVRFCPRVDREAMPDLLRAYDVLIFPSVWEEPLARMTQEAMASGLVVVGTLTGGTPEILTEGETGLTFQAEDAAGLARQLERLVQDPALRLKLAAQARQAVEARFGFDRMLDELESYLGQVVAGQITVNLEAEGTLP